MERKSNIELLRIVAMLSIILHHAVIHGIFGGELTLPTDASREIFHNGTFIYEILFFGGKFGVQIFVLITGYFMISSKISVKSIVKFWTPVFAWSVFFLVLRIIGMPSEESITVKEVVISTFPILLNRYWFAQSYLILYLLIPVLNDIYKRISRNVTNYLLIFLFFTIIIVPTFTNKYLVGDNSTPLFILLYYIGALIKENERLILNYINVFKVTMTLSFMIYILSLLFFNIMGLHFDIEVFLTNATFLGSQFSLIELLFSVSVFILFTQLKIETSKTVNLIASSTFGIYLIHDNFFFRSVLWGRITQINESLTKNQFFSLFKILVCTLLIFIVCSLMELSRSRVMNRTTIFLSVKFEQAVKRFHKYINLRLMKIVSAENSNDEDKYK